MESVFSLSENLSAVLSIAIVTGADFVSLQDGSHNCRNSGASLIQLCYGPISKV